MQRSEMLAYGGLFDALDHLRRGLRRELLPAIPERFLSLTTGILEHFVDLLRRLAPSQPIRSVAP